MNNKNVSNSFQVFLKEAPEHSKAWMEAVQKLDTACSLDEKTEEIAYIAVLAAVGLESGIPFHVKRAKELGASREESKVQFFLDCRQLETRSSNHFRLL